MGKCPNCGKKLNELKLIFNATVVSTCKATSSSLKLNVDSIIDSEKFSFMCPYCGKVITESIDKAMLLLE